MNKRRAFHPVPGCRCTGKFGFRLGRFGRLVPMVEYEYFFPAEGYDPEVQGMKWRTATAAEVAELFTWSTPQ